MEELFKRKDYDMNEFSLLSPFNSTNEKSSKNGNIFGNFKISINNYYFK